MFPINAIIDSLAKVIVFSKSMNKIIAKASTKYKFLLVPIVAIVKAL
jgi:hypothetical protein